MKYKLEQIDPKKLDISKYNIRKRDPHGNTWEEFLMDIEENGVLHAPLVTPSDHVIAGQRRVLAAQKKNLVEIYINRLLEEPDEATAIAMSLRENHHREGVDLEDKLAAAIRLRAIIGNNKAAIARKIGCDPYTVSGWLSAESAQRVDPELKTEGVQKQAEIGRIRETKTFKDMSNTEQKKFMDSAKTMNATQLEQVRREIKRDEKVSKDVTTSHEAPKDSYVVVGVPIKERRQKCLQKKASLEHVSFPDLITRIINEYAEKVGCE